VSRAVLDASALLAVLLQERGSEKVEPHLTSAAISAVNLSEVVAIGLERGLMLESVQSLLTRLSLEVISFDAEQAYVAASLRPATRKLGRSLGYRACLDTAKPPGSDMWHHKENAWPQLTRHQRLFWVEGPFSDPPTSR
jgi:ribonuclease VapC